MRTSSTPGVRKLLSRREQLALREGLRGAVTYGPLLGYPLYGVSITLLSLHRGRATPPEALRVAVALAVQAAVEQAQPVVLEPVMKVRTPPPKRA